MEKAKRKNKGNSLSQKLARTRLWEKEAIDSYETVNLLMEWMRQDILSLAGPQYQIRSQLVEFVCEELQKIEGNTPKIVTTFRRSLQNQKKQILEFALLVDQSIQRICQEFKVAPELVRSVLYLRKHPQTHSEYWKARVQVQQQLSTQFFRIHEALEEDMSHIHRASSMVENLNSRLRNYFFLRRSIGNRYLSLLQFFINHHSFMRSQKAERVGKTPAQLMTGNAHPHWLELLGYTRFKHA